MEKVDSDVNILKRTPGNGRLVGNRNSRETYDFSEEPLVFGKKMSVIYHLSNSFNITYLSIFSYIIILFAGVHLVDYLDALDVSPELLLFSTIGLFFLPILLYWFFDYKFRSPRYSTIYVVSKDNIIEASPFEAQNASYLMREIYKLKNIEDIDYEKRKILMTFNEKDFDIELNEDTKQIQNKLYGI